MTPTEATEAMEIIAMLTENQNGYVGIFENVNSVSVELRAEKGYSQFTAPTLLGALRKAKAAWESEGKK